MKIYANRYEILSHLGHGASGLVLKVRDQKDGSICALKIFSLYDQQQIKESLPVFQTEFDTLKNLNHPFIARIYDAGFSVDDNECYFAVEFVEGAPLDKATDGASFETIELLFVQALRALNYLHQQKVYHFDIKPQNLLIKQQGINKLLKVIDFGLANFYQSSIFQPIKDSFAKIIGTPAYVAPEIIQGKIPDGRADLYSLGIAFYKAFTRQLPFDGTTPEMLHAQHLKEKPASPLSINPQIPDYINKIILKLLEKDPSKRYATAAAVLEDLHLLSEKSYSVETKETLISYVPEKGELVGRRKELQIVEKFYQDRLVTKRFNKPPYLIISGEKGVGKTRIVEAVKYQAQKNLINVLTWRDFLDVEPNEKIPLLVIGDDFIFPEEENTLHYVKTFYQQNPFLFVFAVSKFPSEVSEESIIKLENFTKGETKNYIEKATGISPVPDSIADILFKQTEGNPLFLTEYTKALLQKEILRDSYGSWSQEMLEDLGQEFQSIGATEFIKKRLKEKLTSLNLDEDTRYLLSITALLQNPTSTDLRNFSKKAHSPSFTLESVLENLCQKGILEVDSSDNYSFSNPLYREVVLEEMTPSSKEWCCDAIADYLEKNNTPQDKILYFRSRGSGPSANSDLLKLAQNQRRQTLYDDARESLLYLLDKQKLDEKTKKEVFLELGELSIEKGQPDKAEEWLLKIFDKDKKTKDLLKIRAIELLGLSYKRREKLDAALNYYQQGLDAIQGQPKLTWMEVVLKNRIALTEFDKGNSQKAENLFEETWEIWRKKLNEEEKLLAIRSDIDNVYYLKGEFGKAIACLEPLLEILSRQPTHDMYPIIVYKLGCAYLRKENLAKSEILLFKCLEILKQRKIPYWLYIVYNELGNLFEKKKDWASALTYYQHAFRLSRKATQKSHLFSPVYNIANVLLKMKDWAESQKYFEFVIRIILTKQAEEEPIAGFHLFTSYLGLSNIFRELKALEKACDYLKKAETVFKEKGYLKHYEQYFWQEQADVAKCKNNMSEVQSAMKVLEKLKKAPGFNWIEYKNWQKTSPVTV